MLINNHFKKWITLIEILIWVIIFSIGIITILTVIVKNYMILDKVKIKYVSTMLAKEWIEIIYNKRDTNILRWVERNCNKLNSSFSCTDYFDIWKYYRVNPSISWYYKIENSNIDFTSNILFFHTWDIVKTNWSFLISWAWFNHDSNWEKTFFSRIIWFSWVYLQADWWVWDKNKILKLNSYVFSKKWHITWEVVLESIIWER